ncbi:hypothetical protein MGN70_014692 [Eutypa lata]|nr:hypothetical protein MGN70_014692 [Eutypa lata]
MLEVNRGLAPTVKGQLKTLSRSPLLYILPLNPFIARSRQLPYFAVSPIRSSSEIRPSRSIPSCLESPEYVVSKFEIPVSVDCDPDKTVLIDTESKSGIGKEKKNRETPSEYLHNHPQSATGTPALNTTSPPSFQETDSTLCTADVPIDKQKDENNIACAPPELVSIAEEEPIEDTFRGEVQIPSCSPTIFVYPHSSSAIDTTFQDRYREVINIFRHNTKQHSRLKESAQYIDYTLKLCGTSSKDVHPSILVFCRNSEFKDLKALLTSKELKYQYCLRRKTRKYPWSSSQSLTATESYRPLFNLYFWRQRRPRTLYYWGYESVRLHSHLSPRSQRSKTDPHIVPGLTLCGSIVELLGDRPGLSTAGCVIEIGSEFYVITSRHAFRSPEPKEEHQNGEMSYHQLMDCSSSDISADSTPGRLAFDEESLYGSGADISDTMLEETDYFIDDIEYESLEEEDNKALHSRDNDSTISSDADGNQTKGTDKTGSKFTNVLLPTSDELQSGDLDFD